MVFWCIFEYSLMLQSIPSASSFGVGFWVPKHLASQGIWMYLGLFVFIPDFLWKMMKLPIWWDHHQGKRTYLKTPFLSKGRSTSWSQKPQAVCVRRFVPLDLQKSLRTGGVKNLYQKWPRKLREDFGRFFSEVSEWFFKTSEKIDEPGIYMHIYIQYLVRFEYVLTFPYPRSWKRHERWVVQ